ncbi:hypothetical protein NA23_02250 [Fervidobacterium islandicum]|uniref:Uncharacterized protein n=1 Tax=Fervidobacterium islandicum TaxID=2423 RepID=A0AAI8CKG2_FERIS|nr:hypothetical protein [Fervidobacterium islandicum]AMW32238.1 hypothetical protein NA23_02250 [Fervidobacterium islandicum]
MREEYSIQVRANIKKHFFFNLLLIVLSVVAFVFLVLSVNNLKGAFKKLESANVVFDVEFCEQRGISLVCDGNLRVVTPGVEHEIEMVQLRVFTEDGKYIGSWTNDNIDDERFTFSVTNAGLFGKAENRIIMINGFVKIKLDIGRYGFKMNLPIEEEVKVSERR